MIAHEKGRSVGGDVILSPDYDFGAGEECDAAEAPADNGFGTLVFQTGIAFPNEPFHQKYGNSQKEKGEQESNGKNQSNHSVAHPLRFVIVCKLPVVSLPYFSIENESCT